MTGADEVEARGRLQKIARRVVQNPAESALLEVDENGIATRAWARAGLEALKLLFDNGDVFTDTGPSGPEYFDLRDALELAVDPPDPFFADAHAYVMWESSRTRADRPDKWGLLAKHGSEYLLEPRPDDIPKGPWRACFANALGGAARRPETLAYVEGIAGGKGGPGGGADHFVDHAWVTPGDGRAIDVTWPPPRSVAPSYFGVRLSDTTAIEAVLRERNGYGVFSIQDNGIAALLERFPELR